MRKNILNIFLLLFALILAANSSHAQMAVDTSIYYSILNTLGKTQLNISGADKNDNGKLIFWYAEKNVPMNSLFKFVATGNAGEYRIVAAHSRKALTGRGKGQQIVQMPVSDDSQQIVAIDDMGEGAVKIRFTYSNMFFNGLGGTPNPWTWGGEWSEQKNANNDVFKLVPYKTVEEIDKAVERDFYNDLFSPFAEALKDGNLELASEIVAKHPLSERREALAAVVSIYRGDVAGGEAVLDRLAAISSDERLFDQIATLYERREYIQRLYSPAMNEERFKQKGMEYLEAAVRIQLLNSPFEQKITMTPPLKGRWAIASGPKPLRAYHSTFMGFFGYDMYFSGRFEDSFGKPVYAVADGVVKLVINDNEDNAPDVRLDPTSKANMIILEHETGLRSLYVHMKKKSAMVAQGERVQAGQQIASMGNSGFTTGAHLHFEISRIDNNFTLPVRMSGLYRYKEEIGFFEPMDDPSVADGIYSDAPNLPVSNGRSYSYNGGKFVRTEGDNWNEFKQDELKFRFVENRRSAGLVYLYDERRHVMVRFPEVGGIAEYSTDQEQTWIRFQAVIMD